MARIVNTITKPILTLVIRTILNDGTFSDVTVKEGDIVTDFRYVGDGSIKKVTGRVSKINYKNSEVKRLYNTAKRMKSSFKFDVTPVSIEIDSSTAQHSSVTVIPTMDILEVEGTTNVKKVNTFFKYGFNATVYLSDNTSNTYSIQEGEFVNGIVYLATDEKTVNSKVVAITYDKTLNPLKLQTITDNKIKTIDVIAIKDAGTVIEVVEPGTKSITEVISEATTKDVFISAGTVTEPITANKDLSINGDKVLVAATPSTRDVKNLTGETILSKGLTVTTSSELEVKGVALTEDAKIVTGPATKTEMSNCIITSLNPDAAKSFVVLTGNTPTLMDIEGCYFGDNKTLTGKAFRNTLEMNCKLKDGSVISNNYFADGCSGNNDICIYDAEENAHITIENNVWEKSANGIRIGTKGDANCTITINNNTYYSTEEEYPEYAGLVLIQPYGTVTTSMKHVTVYINNTHHTDNNQIFYLYSGGKDMKFTTDTLPTVYVDGVLQDLTRYING